MWWNAAAAVMFLVLAALPSVPAWFRVSMVLGAAIEASFFLAIRYMIRRTRR